MEYLPLGVGAAVGLGAGLVDREEAKLPHSQLLYRGGGLAASLWAQHKGMGPPNLAPSLVAAFAATLAARTTALFLAGTLHEFGATRRGVAQPWGDYQYETNPTAAGAARLGVDAPWGDYQYLTTATAAGAVAPTLPLPTAAGATGGCPCGHVH